MAEVIKRDGRKVEFCREKIKDAVLKAFEEVDKNITSEAKDKASSIALYIEKLGKEIYTVERSWQCWQLCWYVCFALPARAQKTGGLQWEIL